MDKIAIIADIHGNREALKTVLKDIQTRDCNKIICLGDIIHKGKFSNECVELVKNNCDDFFTKNHDLNCLNEQDKQSVLKYRKELTGVSRKVCKLSVSKLVICGRF